MQALANLGSEWKSSLFESLYTGQRMALWLGVGGKNEAWIAGDRKDKNIVSLYEAAQYVSGRNASV